MHVGLQSLALDLILALQSLPASRLLPSNSLSRNLFGDLSRLNSAVNSDGFDLERITPLLNAVRNNEFDEVVWNKVYAAIIESTPPPRPIPLHNQTPTRDCSEALRNFQQSPIKKVIQRLHCLPQDTSSNPDHIFWNTPYIKLLSETHCNRSLACSDSAAAWVRLGPSNTGRVPVGSGTSSAGCLAS